MTFSKSIVKKIATGDTKRPNSAQIEIDNPLDADTFVNGIELILSPEFSKKGNVIIEINEIVEFDANQSELFLGYSKFPIPLSKVLRRGEKIRIYAWNGEDDNVITLNVNTAISSEPQPFNSQAESLGTDVLNSAVSGTENVFELDDYSDETVTQLISLVGNSSIILMMAASDALSPQEDDRNSEWTNDSNMTDGNLANASDSTLFSSPYNVNDVRQIWFDFGEALNRTVGIKMGFNPSVVITSSPTFEARVYESADDVSYSLLHTETFTPPLGSFSTIQEYDLSLTPNSASRYFRIDYIVTVAGTGSSGNIKARVYEVYDYNRTTGSASLSFDILEKQTNQWIEYISASDIGAFTEGAAIQKQIGSTIEDDPVSNKFNRFLPSTQDSFRAKLIVTGNLRTAVTIIKGR